jgi:hypothetical protein
MSYSNKGESIVLYPILCDVLTKSSILCIWRRVIRRILKWCAVDGGTFSGLIKSFQLYFHWTVQHGSMAKSFMNWNALIWSMPGGSISVQMLILPCLDTWSWRHSPHPTDSSTAQAPFRTPVVTRSAILEPVHHFVFHRFTNAQVALPAVAPWQFRGPNRRKMKIQSLGPWNMETAASISNMASKSAAGERESWEVNIKIGPVGLTFR